ncbi:von Ebner gland protein 2-like [Nannospalax galili]|uniref:von Ebner gland protein 2-like n=1 Tax=Nannospalax galili TaxID=1026970 RepID=UPI0004ED50D6|nr:von Ebner gland protein 2-like [Nannospalax galili]
MKALLLTFGLGLIAALQAQTFPTLEEDQDVSGTWYLKATAPDKEIPKKLGSVSVSPMTIKTLEGGSLQVKFTTLVFDQCQNMSIILEKTDQPGKYTASSTLFACPVSGCDLEQRPTTFLRSHVLPEAQLHTGSAGHRSLSRRCLRVDQTLLVYKGNTAEGALAKLYPKAKSYRMPHLYLSMRLLSIKVANV